MPLPAFAWWALGGAAALGALRLSGAGEGPAPGAWYRVRVRTDLAKTDLGMLDPMRPDSDASRRRQVVAQLRKLGFAEPNLVIRDDRPTYGRDPRPADLYAWEAWARFDGPRLGRSDVLEITMLEAVRHPRPFMVTGPVGVTSPGPTPGLPVAWGIEAAKMNPWLIEAITVALSLDADPANLDAFALALMPEFPRAANVVRAKRDALIAEAHAAASYGYLRALHAGSRPAAGGSPASGARVAGFFSGWTPERLLNPFDLGSVDVLNVPLLAPYNAAISILEGERVDRAILKAGREILESAKTVAPYVQMGISFIPGVGTVASAAIGAGLALAQGRSLDDALIAGIKGAVPGGPLAVAAFETGVRTIGALTEGKSLDAVALEFARAAAVSAARAASGGNEEIAKAAGVAFDTSVAVAQGRKIQDVAAQAARGVLPGGTRGKNAFDAAVGLAKGKNLADVAVQSALSEYRRAMPDGPERLAFDAGLAVARGQDPRQAMLSAAQRLVPGVQGAQRSFEMTERALRGEATPATLAGAAARFAPNVPGNPSPSLAEADRIASYGLQGFTRPELWMDPAATDAQGNALDLKARQEMARAAREQQAAAAIDDRLAGEKATARSRADENARRAAEEARVAAEISFVRNAQIKRRILSRWGERYLHLAESNRRGGLYLRPVADLKIYSG